MAPLRTLAAGLLSFAAQVLAYSNPLKCTGVCGDGHDPSIIRRASDGTYFRLSTGAGGRIYTAPAMTGPWVYKCDMLPSGSSIDSSGKNDLWAPDVSLVGSTYYVYYSVSQFGTQESTIGLATSDTMNCGTWTGKRTCLFETRMTVDARSRSWFGRRELHFREGLQ